MTQSSGTTLVVPSVLRPLAQMALLLERLEQLPRGADADQYRTVARRVAERLAEAIDAVEGEAADPAGREILDRLLNAFPATSAIYENLRYEHAGLCRTPIEASLDAELVATAAIRRARTARGDRAASAEDGPSLH